MPPATQATQIVPGPSMSIPLSQSIDTLASELENYKLDSPPLREISAQLDGITTHVVHAQLRGDITILHSLLNEVMISLHDVNTTLKLLCVTERARLPTYMLEHITRVKKITEKTMDDTASILQKYSHQGF